MTRVYLLLSVILICIPLLSTSASAQGTHFIVEGGVGVMQGFSPEGEADLGRSTNLMFGVGGRPGGSWLRFYFVLEGLNGTYMRPHEQNFRIITLERTMNELGAGVRIFAPCTPNFRLFADLEGVVVFSTTHFEGAYTYDFDTSEVDGGFRMGFGFHYRPVELFSIGARFSLTAAFDHFDSEDGRAWLVGFESEYGHFEAGLSMALHF